MILDLLAEAEAAEGMTVEDLAVVDEVAEMAITCSLKAEVGAAYLPTIKVGWGMVPSKLIMIGEKHNYNG